MYVVYTYIKYTYDMYVYMYILLILCVCYLIASLTGDYSGSSSSEEEDEDQSSPRERVLKNSKGQSDFRIKDIKIAPYGRKEIEMAEQGNASRAGFLADDSNRTGYCKR